MRVHRKMKQIRCRMQNYLIRIYHEHTRIIRYDWCYFTRNTSVRTDLFLYKISCTRILARYTKKYTLLLLQSWKLCL